jgi:hypothetical protein
MDHSLRTSFALLLTLAGLAAGMDATRSAGDFPEHLRDTGLYAANGGFPRADLHAFTPQYPLWSDGTEKRRWIFLPAGTRIDASDPDAWSFPRGTKLWKEFSLHGRRFETRYAEHGTDGTWRFAAYVWDETGTEAVLAPRRGVTLTGVSGMPRGRYAVPSRGDCMVCHESAVVPVLGFSALQLSPDRARPARAGEADLRSLAADGLLRNLPAMLAVTPPRIPAATPIERAALGMLHGNCAHCHNGSANRAPLPLTFSQGVTDPVGRYRDVLRSTIDAPSRWRSPDAEDDAALDARIIMPGNPESSVIAIRMQSRHAATQMPPLGTTLPDTESLELIRRWIKYDLTQPMKENRP